MSEHSILHKASPQQKLFYQSLKYLGNGNAQLQLPLTFHMGEGKYVPLAFSAVLSYQSGWGWGVDPEKHW